MIVNDTSDILTPDTWSIGLYAGPIGTFATDKILGADSGAVGQVGPSIRGLTDTPPIDLVNRQRVRRDGSRLSHLRYQNRTVTIPVFIELTSPRAARDERERIISAFEPRTKRARLDVYLPTDDPYSVPTVPSITHTRRLTDLIYAGATNVRLLKHDQRRYVFSMQFTTDGDPHFTNTDGGYSIPIPDANTHTFNVTPLGTIETPPRFDFRGLNGGVVVEHREAGIQCEVQHTGDLLLDMDPLSFDHDAWTKITTFSDFFTLEAGVEAHIDVRYTTAPTESTSTAIAWSPRWAQC